MSSHAACAWIKSASATIARNPLKRGDESELPKFFAQIEIELDALEMFLPVKRGKIVFERQFEQAHHEQHSQRDQAPRHNSFP